MAIKIAVFNQKGGVGKTTSTMNIAADIAARGKHVLVIDKDPQKNCSKHFLAEHEREDGYSIENVLLKQISLEEGIIQVQIRNRGNAKPKYRNLDLLPGSSKLLEIISELSPDTFRDEIVLPADKIYDYIFFDCPTQGSDISVETLKAADYIIVPASPDDDSLDGYGQLLDTVNRIKTNGWNNNLKIAGVFFTNVDTRTSFEKYIVNEFGELLGEEYLGSVRHMAVCKESTYAGRPLIYYAPKSAVTEDYRQITNRLLKKVEG